MALADRAITPAVRACRSTSATSPGPGALSATTMTPRSMIGINRACTSAAQAAARAALS